MGWDRGHTETSWQPHSPSKGSSALQIDPLIPPLLKAEVKEEKLPKKGSLAAPRAFSPSLEDEEELWVIERGSSSKSRDLRL